jgi:Protein kinase domain
LVREVRSMGDRDAGPISDAEPSALVGTALGGFRLTSLLAVGGMAEVYRGYDPQLERYVAVKVLPGHVAQDLGYVARFRREAQRVAALDHPNIVPVFQSGEEHGLLYLVMPLLKESLRDRMSREGALDPVEAVFMAVELAVALEAAHRQGLVHRDVKPENILLNDDGRPLLSDFGIAREVEVLRDPAAVRTLARSGLPVGTPEYMAPEQLRGAVADQRVDVYSLGTVLYELLTGHVPHEGGTPYEVVARVLTEAPMPPTSYNPTIWPELADVVLVAVASDPERRYPNMASLAEALRQAVLAKGAGPVAALPARSPASTRLIPAAAGTSGHADIMPLATAGDVVVSTRRDWRGSSGFIATAWGDAMKSRPRRTLLVAAVAAVMVLALGASGAVGMLIARQPSGPAPAGKGSATVPATATATVVPTTGQGPVASATVATTPTVVPPTHVPAPTATPLLTPTIVASSSPLHATPLQTQKNCLATQKLINISAVDAQWSWSNTPPTGGGWQYSTVSPTTGPWSGTPPALTTPPHSSLYVYIKAPRADTDPSCTKYNDVVATITVTGGNGTQFTVYY